MLKNKINSFRGLGLENKENEVWDQN